MSDTYADVDGAAAVAEAIAWQERLATWEPIAAYKRHMDELTAVAGAVLDVGGGPGLDAARVGAVVVDRSLAMARHGRTRGVPYAVGDACRLPIATASVAAVRCDRVLQHLDDPRPAVAELARCLRPGGRLAVADPDQTTLEIDVPGAPQPLVERVRTLRRDVGYRSGTYISALPATLPALGFVDVAVRRFELVLDDPDDAFGIASWVDHWAAHGFTPADDERWRAAVAGSAIAGFRYAVTYVVVGATRRSTATSTDHRHQDRQGDEQEPGDAPRTGLSPDPTPPAAR